MAEDMIQDKAVLEWLDSAKGKRNTLSIVIHVIEHGKINKNEKFTSLGGKFHILCPLAKILYVVELSV